MYRHIRLMILLGCIAILSGIWVTERQFIVQAQDTFDRGAMLASIYENVMAPAQQQFLEATLELEMVVDTFTTDPTVENLMALQDAWRLTSNAWDQMSIFALDLRLEAMHNQVYKPPLNVDFVIDILEGSDDITEIYVENLGSTSRGLPAVEYLIFSRDMSDADIVETFEETRRVDFLIALSQNLVNKAEQIQTYWSEDGRNYAETFIDRDNEGGVLRGSINMLINDMFVTLEMDLQRRLGRPSGIEARYDADPDSVESPLSGHSLEHIQYRLIGFKALFNGGDEESDNLGFDDYLDFLGAEVDDRLLSDVINERFDVAIATIDSAEQPLRILITDNLEQVETMYESMRQLLILIRVDMVSQLNVLVTFSDADGDQ